MALWERLRFFRRRKGLTQRELGLRLGFSERSADVRVAQYESGARCPKSDVVRRLSEVFNVSEKALVVPDLEGPVGIMHMLFVLEDLYGVKVGAVGQHPFLYFEKSDDPKVQEFQAALLSWEKMSAAYESGQVSREQYDNWRYRFGGQRVFRDGLSAVDVPGILRK